MSEIVDAALAATVEYENGTGTVRSYLKDLLHTLWVEEEGFSGKRPFGNSGWQFDVYQALVRAGVLEGTLDDEGFLDDVDRDAGEQLVLAAIQQVFAS